MKENYCVVCKKTHSSRKWYNHKELGGKWCIQQYLKEYHQRKGKADQRKRYQEDEEYREKVKAINRKNDHARRATGWKQKRKPRELWTEEEHQKAKDAKARYKEAHPEKVIESNKKTHAKHYEENKEQYRYQNAEARKTPEFQYSYLKSDAARKGRTVTLTREEYIEMRACPCRYCERQLEETGVCLDRWDNRSTTYSKTEAVPCCHECNDIKGGELTGEEMLQVAHALKEYRRTKVLPTKIKYPLFNIRSKYLNPTTRYKIMVTRAKKANIEVGLTEEQFKQIMTGQCDYCDATVGAGSGIDRKDSNLGYVLGNCVPCCGFCNRVKGKRLNYEEMLVVSNAIQKFRMAS